jgi:hypothetical protein
MLRKLNMFKPFERWIMSKLELRFRMTGLSLARNLMEPLVL